MKDSLPNQVASKFNTNHVASRVTERYLYARRLVAMSLSEAKGILGFPSSSFPSPEEVNRSWKSLAFQNHPDRGGDPVKMRDINVARDVLLGKSRATWTPNQPPTHRPKPKPEIIETIPGQDFAAALSKAGVPASAEWKCISKPIWASTPGKTYAWNNYVWTLIGVTDNKVWVLSVKRRPANLDKTMEGVIEILEDWQANLVSTPSNKDLAKLLPKLVRSPSVLFDDGVAVDPPKKWLVWDQGRPTAVTITKVKAGSGGAALKDVLVSSGLLKAQEGGPVRKSTVEIIPHISKERGERMRAENGRLYHYQMFEYEVRVNGKSAPLSDDTIKNLEKNGFVMSIFDYAPNDNRPKQLHMLRGSRFKADAAAAIRLLADSLTSEPSWLHISLEKAAEEFEDGVVKAASQDQDDGGDHDYDD